MSLHPQVEAFLQELAAQNLPGWNEMSPEQGRELFASRAELFGTPPTDLKVENHLLAGNIPIRIYTPAADPPAPALMYFHGGGWVLGDLDTHDVLCRDLAMKSSCVVVAVDYRRAPEHRYPDAFDDCYRATCHIAEQASTYGIDPSRLAVGGDSAGGNLAAAVALKARDRAGPKLAWQLLIYPAVDSKCNSTSYHTFAEGYGLTGTVMTWFWEQYLPTRTTETDPYAAPMLAPSFEGLPPAHIVLAEADVLHDEGAHYAEKLRQAGVPVTVERYDGMIHGFVHFQGVFDVGKRAIQEIGQRAQAQLHPTQ